MPLTEDSRKKKNLLGQHDLLKPALLYNVKTVLVRNVIPAG